MFAEARFRHKLVGSIRPAIRKNKSMKVIRIENPGPGYTLAMGEAPRPMPGAGEVLVKVAGAGLNRADIAQSMGVYPPPPGAPETPAWKSRERLWNLVQP
jgi:hypothetical protein